jgi:hypothetical protein
MIWTKKAEWVWGLPAPPPASGWMGGRANLIWLLVGRYVPTESGRTSPTTAKEIMAGPCALEAHFEILLLKGKDQKKSEEIIYYSQLVLHVRKHFF